MGKDFFKAILELGEAISNMADVYRGACPNSYGRACGMVVGMALNAFSKHDNTTDILQTAAALETYAQSTKSAQANKIMMQ